MAEIIVAGGGAAGMMAACAAAEQGNHVTLLEQNEKTGKKIYITGKGRCNLTNACDTDQVFEKISRNPSFLYSSIYTFDNLQTMEWFEKRGLRIKTERGGRVFPQSDHSSDVIRTLNQEMKRLGVSVCLQTVLEEILTEPLDEHPGERTEKGKKQKPAADRRIIGAVCRNRENGKKIRMHCDALILAAGGLSYPSTGSNGSGFALARQCGHTTTEFRPSLVPFEVEESCFRDLQGLSLRNVTLTIEGKRGRVFSEFGELLFTHFGISGPLVLIASSRIPDGELKNPLRFAIDLKPALDRDALDQRVQRDFREASNRQFSNALGRLLPAKLIPVIVELSGIDPAQKVHSVTRAQRERLVDLLKGLPGTITGLRGYNEAVITRGGIPVGEINPSTMESKRTRGLYFAGEMIDCDALTGGFNLQIAWSTGYLAGKSAGAQEDGNESS